MHQTSQHAAPLPLQTHSPTHHLLRRLPHQPYCIQCLTYHPSLKHSHPTQPPSASLPPRPTCPPRTRQTISPLPQRLVVRASRASTRLGRRRSPYPASAAARAPNPSAQTPPARGAKTAPRLQTGGAGETGGDHSGVTSWLHAFNGVARQGAARAGQRGFAVASAEGWVEATDARLLGGRSGWERGLGARARGGGGGPGDGVGGRSRGRGRED